MTGGCVADHRDWVAAALGDAGAVATIDVDGVRIHARVWGSARRPTLLLIHGGAAHARWWDMIAPLLAPTHRVIAVDLSGHGDSGHREAYSVERWAEEVMAAAEQLGGRGRPVLAGHSMGGFVAIAAAARHSDRTAGIIVIDSPVRRPTPEAENEARGAPFFGNPKTYPDRETAIERFLLVPPQPHADRRLIEHAALTGLQQVAGGWTWKFDPGMFRIPANPIRPAAITADLCRVDTRLAFVNGQRSELVDPAVRAHVAEVIEQSHGGRGVPVIEIPEAHHHLMFDRPLELVTALRTLLAAWEAAPASPVPADPTVAARDGRATSASGSVDALKC